MSFLPNILLIFCRYDLACFYHYYYCHYCYHHYRYHHYSFIFIFKSALRGLTILVFREINHYDDVIMGAMASQISSLPIVHSTIYSDAKKTSKLCVTGLCAGNSPGTVNSPHKWPVTRKISPFDDVIMWRPWWLLMQYFMFQAISSQGNEYVG